jgi:SAM-dependent methyltransferase/uncharacterized protein YbaR (Trm112 family)
MGATSTSRSISVNTPANSLLACPRCQQPLPSNAATLRCQDCNLDFPDLDGLPCLFPEPHAALGDWRTRWHLALHELALDEAANKRALSACTRNSTGSRLRRLVKAYQTQQRELRKVLRPLDNFDSTDHATALALKTRLPSHHGLLSYAPNLFRDWCWGDVENQALCDAILTAYQATVDEHPLPSMLNVLILGAGAGRLSADIHRALAPKLTYALDSNPLLGLVAQRLWQGHKLKLVEFPMAPKSVACSAVEQQLADKSEPAGHSLDGLKFLLADALHAPFLPASFDLVITPWLTDVIDCGADELVPRINHLLKPGGIWLNTGSMTFAHADPASCHSFEELTECAISQGFQASYHDEQQVPYLASPHSRHQRVETLCTSAWRKKADAAALPPYQHLPNWLALGQEPIPAIDAFTLQASTTRVHAFIMSLIDGERSIADIAKVLAEEQLMAAQDAEVALRGFLLKMLEEAAAKNSR